MRRIALALATLAATTAARAAGPARDECALTARDTAWMQTAIDNWETLSRQVLEIPVARLPWIVLYDRSCVFHIAAEERLLSGARPAPAALRFLGQPVRVVVQPYVGDVPLPEGDHVAPRIAAATRLYGEGSTKTYFFTAMPALWRADKSFPSPDEAERFALGVMAHELVHTLELARLHGQIRAVVAAHPTLPQSLDDDIVQERFGKNPAFVAAYDKERDALDAAIAATDPKKRQALTRRALALIRDRQRHFYRGDDAGFAELEEIFLHMEGVAVWAHWKLAELHPERVYFEKKRDKFWSQSEGYALFRLIDELVPDWKRRVLAPRDGDEAASPLALLEAAVGVSTSTK